MSKLSFADFVKKSIVCTIFILGSHFIPFSIAQNAPCGTPDFPESHLESIEGIVGGLSTSPSSPAVPNSKIPVWIYIFDSSTSPLPWSNEGCVAAVLNANPFFSDIFTFSVCGVTRLVNDDYYNFYLTEGQTLFPFINGLNEPLDDHCVKIFFTNTVQTQFKLYSGSTFSVFTTGINFENSGVVVSTPSGSVIGHELGHYFGLPHTFAGGQPNQYVSYQCALTGDRFCDTPADLEEGCTPNNDCSIATGCPLEDPLGETYMPDPSLLMSYYGCSYRFSPQQKATMQYLYLYSDNLSELRNSDAACVLPEYGSVIKNCGVDYDSEPLPDLPVKIFSGNQNCESLTNENGLYLTQPFSCPLFYSSQRSLRPRKSPIDYQNPDPFYLAPLNGDVTSHDIDIIGDHLTAVGPFISNPYFLIAADANGSGNISLKDVFAIRKVILGLSNDFPVGSWRYVPKIWFDFPEFNTQFFDGNPFDAVIASDPFQGFPVIYKTSVPSTKSWMDILSIDITNIYSHYESGWSFDAIKVGDVECENIAEPDNPQAFNIPGYDGSSTSALSGDQKIVQIISETPIPVSSWQIALSYPREMLDVVEMRPGNSAFAPDSLSHSFFDGSQTGLGEIRAIWADTAILTDNINNKILFEILIEAEQNLSNIEGLFKINGWVLPHKFYDAAGEEVNVSFKIRVLGAEDPRASNQGHIDETALKVAPVPFDDYILFLLGNKQINYHSRCSIEIFNGEGVKVANMVKDLMPDQNEIKVLNTDQWPQGIYYYRLILDDKVYSGTITK